MLPGEENLILQWVLTNYTRSSTQRLSPVFRSRRRRCLPLHVAGTVDSTTFQRLYVVDDVPWTSACGLPRGGARMQPLEPADCSPRPHDVPVLVPRARCAPAAGGMNDAAPLRHQGQAPENQEQQRCGLRHQQYQYSVKRKGAHSPLTRLAGTFVTPGTRTVPGTTPPIGQ